MATRAITVQPLAAPLRAARHARVRASSRRTVCLAAPQQRSPGVVQALDSVLQAAEAGVAHWIAAVQQRAAARLQRLTLGLLLALQRLIRWAQLAAVALHLQQRGAQPQLAFAGAAAAVAASSSGGDDAPASPSPSSSGSSSSGVAPAAPAPSSAPDVMGFLSGAATGAVEQLRHTLCDASAGIDSKMTALNRTASDLQGTLFRAAQAHSEAVRSNPEGGMWKQPSVEAVISEEERLRQAVFAQVYAELLQKDNDALGFTAQP